MTSVGVSGIFLVLSTCMEHFNYLRAEQVTMLGLSLPEPCSGREMMERCVRRHREALDSLFPRLMLRPIYEQQCCFGQYLLFEGKSICDLFVSCPKWHTAAKVTFEKELDETFIPLSATSETLANF
ncbi:hypothetical protein ADUPG1_012087 [Aduncisulcus paluster]|uniref:Uncharacterized protein n=2 Tax=Aduncisulcus paluster TaxID=2918883 RepID=A0ABQ5JY84_9EUKA|nr:hypothetical protein ADUPG1_012087 [Aduncisulcus paluster]